MNSLKPEDVAERLSNLREARKAVDMRYKAKMISRSTWIQLSLHIDKEDAKLRGEPICQTEDEAHTS